MGLESAPCVHPAAAPPRLHLRRDCAHRCHICTGTGLTPATSAPGLGSPLPHLHWDCAHHSHRPCALQRSGSSATCCTDRAQALSPSSLIFYLGVRARLANLLHHNLFFDEARCNGATCCGTMQPVAAARALGFVGRRGVACRSSMRMRRAYSTRRSGRVHRCST